jgi:hypothetical protein
MDAKVVESGVVAKEAESRNVSPVQRVAGCLRWDWGWLCAGVLCCLSHSERSGLGARVVDSWWSCSARLA